ncbi:hypothetical protein GCM10010837_21120 [Aminobacter niigataensis]
MAAPRIQNLIPDGDFIRSAGVREEVAYSPAVGITPLRLGFASPPLPTSWGEEPKLEKHLSICLLRHDVAAVDARRTALDRK